MNPLTDEMRAWLRQAQNQCLPTWDFLLSFLRAFGLTPEEGGAILAAWIRETI